LTPCSYKAKKKEKERKGTEGIRDYENKNVKRESQKEKESKETEGIR
jgi:hypothetical protein